VPDVVRHTCGSYGNPVFICFNFSGNADEHGSLLAFSNQRSAGN
jgi:hypothetical protein